MGVCSMGTGARSTCRWKMGVQRHGEPYKYIWENKPCRKMSGENILSFHVNKKRITHLPELGVPGQTKCSRGRKQILKSTMAETSYFCRKGREYWEHWNYRTIQLKFPYSYVCSLMCFEYRRIAFAAVVLFWITVTDNIRTIISYWIKQKEALG